ncbi:hypothetical protein B6I21_09650 [candidate division KSB1 bacterium 4572_119]|nr:MAG: hypothetical protein B6I21_09650 [candidate division KSB1 bacterium 4572_119]
MNTPITGVIHSCCYFRAINFQQSGRGSKELLKNTKPVKYLTHFNYRLQQITTINVDNAGKIKKMD